MKLAIQIISWVMLVIGILAVIALIVEADQGTSGNGAGIALSLVWIVQSILVLIYTYGIKEVEYGE